MLEELYLGELFKASTPFKQYQNTSRCNNSSLELDMNKENNTSTKIFNVTILSDLQHQFTKKLSNKHETFS